MTQIKTDQIDQTISINKDKMSFAEWLAAVLLPQDETPDDPTIQNIVVAMQAWNAAEIADAIGSIIGRVCLDAKGNPDVETAQRFSKSEVIQKAIWMRRGSRLNAVRNLDRIGVAMAALYEAMNIAVDVLQQRDEWQVPIDRTDTLEAAEVEAKDTGYIASAVIDKFDDHSKHEEMQAEDNFFSEMLLDREMDEIERLDTYYESRMQQTTLRREELRREEVVWGKLNKGSHRRKVNSRNSGQNRSDVIWSRAMNALRRTTTRRWAIA